MKKIFVLLLVVLLGAACGPAFTAEDERLVTAVAEPDISHSTADIIIIYGRSGGFAGLQQEWTIHANGQIDLPDGSQKQVDAAQVQALFDTVTTANFQSLNESYMPKNTCCDLFTYTVTVQAGNERQTITMMDEAPNVPAELTAVHQTIDDLIQNAE